jgi:hypothetical protein
LQEQVFAAAGVLLSGIGVADELAMTFKDLRKWKEQDQPC